MFLLARVDIFPLPLIQWIEEGGGILLLVNVICFTDTMRGYCPKKTLIL